MVFANLTQRDKDAFFALLDEYFASRPHLFNGDEAPSNVKAMKKVNGAASNPANSALANAFTGRGRPAPPPRPAEPALAKEEESEEEEPEEEVEEEEVKPVSVASRVAALKANPPPAPRRTSATTSRENAPTPGSTSSTPSGLVSGRSIGGINTASKGSAAMSLFKKSSPKPGTEPVLPSAFPKEKGGFAPPPQRVNSAGSGKVGRKSPQPPRATPPAPVEEPDEQEYSGEWAEALYDFSSNDSTDLSITAGERLLITERNSKDWWTAESDSGQGLVPVAYVKLL